MKSVIVFTSVILVITATSDQEKWEEFKKTNGRLYDSPEEEQTRFGIFQENLRKIEEHNAKYVNGEKTYFMGVTPLADKTKYEFQSLLNYGKSAAPPKTFDISNLTEVSDSDVPDSFDWTSKGVLTEVKDQGSCGSSWAFSATGALESAYAIKTGNKVYLSEQNLVDCSSLYGNSGCHGGVMEYAFKYVRDFGIETENDYPYKGANEVCEFSPKISVFKASGYKTMPHGDEKALKKAVATVGPVAVGINGDFLQHYAGGIFSEGECDRVPNHGMLVVGYGSFEGTPYWILKNSWGPSWGEDGYMKMIRVHHNQCGIADAASYPTV